MSAIALLQELESQGIKLVVKDGNILGKPKPQEELLNSLRDYKQEIIDILGERQAIKAALLRLQLGETQAIRLCSRTCQGELLILRNKEIPDSITVDCPTFTLPELTELIGQDKEMCAKIYMVKQVFEGSNVVSNLKSGDDHGI